MKLTILALLAVSAFAQSAEPDPSKPTAKTLVGTINGKVNADGSISEAKPAQFTHEQKDQLKQAALELFWTKDQATTEIAKQNERMRAVENAYAKLQNEMLAAVKACA